MSGDYEKLCSEHDVLTKRIESWIPQLSVLDEGRRGRIDVVVDKLQTRLSRVNDELDVVEKQGVADLMRVSDPLSGYGTIRHLLGYFW